MTATLENQCIELDRDCRKLKLALSELESEKATLLREKSEEAATKESLETQMATLQPKLANQQALALTIEKMQGVLKKSESDKNKLASDKEKLESYTKKALHNVQDKYMLAIQTIKEQLKEKDERIVRLTDQYKQFRHQSQREAQLMSSAIYELGMSITEQRLVRNLDRSSSKANLGAQPSS